MVGEQHDQFILAADVGGTNTTIAVIAVKDLSVIYKEETQTQNIHSFAQHVREFLERVGKKNLAPTRGCFAGAGPITTHGKNKYRQIAMSNAKIVISEENLIEETSLEEVLVINDFDAIAYATLVLDKSEKKVIHKGKYDERGTKVVIGSGTGLGCARMCYNSKSESFVSIGSELAHTDFPVATQDELRLVEYIKQTERLKGNVSCEMLLSGPGIERIHAFYTGDHLTAEEIMETKDAKSAQTKDTFKRALAKVCRNMIVLEQARGGLYITGGIIAKNNDLLDKKFLEKFQTHPKKHFSVLLKDTQITVITDYGISLKGAAKALLQQS